MSHRFSALHRARTVVGAVVFCLLATTVAGQAQTAKIPLNVGVIKIAALADVYAAQKLGYFADQGLDVTLTVANSGQVLLAGLAAGSPQITLSIPGTAMQARDKAGYKLVLVSQNEIAHLKAPDQSALMVKADGPIASVKDLTGKKIAYGQINNQHWAGIRDILAKNGVDPKSTQDVEIPYSQMGNALDRGLVDAVAADEPFVSTMLDTKRGRVVAWNYVDSVPGQPIGAFWATEDWAAKNPATVRAFRTAMHTAMTYLTAHPDVAANMVAEFTGVQPDAMPHMTMVLWSDRVVRANWEKTIQMMARNGLISPTFKFSDIVPADAVDAGK
jgi:NitT/TauT family transport system substrate-binding protein